MFEVRMNRRVKDCPVYSIACTSDDDGFKVVSVILVGPTEIALVDCQWTMSNAHRVLAEILELNKPLKTIYITHAHPDHYFGLEVFVQAFPEVTVYALPEVCRTLDKQFFGKLEEWQEEIGFYNCPSKESTLTPLTGDDPHFFVDGVRCDVIPRVWGDLKYNTVVHIPALSTLIGSDVLFHEAHPFTCEVTAEERALWIEELDRLQALGCETVIPGHALHGLPYDDGSFHFTKAYLIATEEELARCKTKGEFYYNMAQRFPKAELFRSNEMNSNVFLGGREWEWRDEELD